MIGFGYPHPLPLRGIPSCFNTGIRCKALCFSLVCVLTPEGRPVLLTHSRDSQSLTKPAGLSALEDSGLERVYAWGRHRTGQGHIKDTTEPGINVLSLTRRTRSREGTHTLTLALERLTLTRPKRSPHGGDAIGLRPTHNGAPFEMCFRWSL